MSQEQKEDSPDKSSSSLPEKKNQEKYCAPMVYLVGAGPGDP